MGLKYFSEFQKVMEMMDDYMQLTISYDYQVQNITYDLEKEFMFEITESRNNFFLYVKNWEIYNSNGEKCIDVMRSAYDDCPDILVAIDRFEEKWSDFRK